MTYLHDREINPLFAIDGYKTSHRQQYPDETQYVFGNFTPRANKFFTREVFDNPKLIWSGTQAFVMEWLLKRFKRDFFQQPREEIVQEFKAFTDRYLGKDSVKEDCFRALHRLGYLPIEIKAIPEGHEVDVRIPVLTIKNTLPEFFWLTNYLETLLSAELWPVATSSTIAFNYRVLCELYSELTCDDNSHITWQAHDFSARGSMGMFANSLTGMGHLTSFAGSDSVFAVRRAEIQYYSGINYQIGGSIPATEHSVMCAGEKDGEEETFRRLLVNVYPAGPVSVVSDTWSLGNVLTRILPNLKQVVLDRDGTLVIRPDSTRTSVADIICGRLDCKQDSQGRWYALSDWITNQVDGRTLLSVKPDAVEVPEWEIKGGIQLLWETFGGTVNGKGFKVLDSHVRMIYGDSITPAVAKEIFERLMANGFASSNIVLGIGSFTYQYTTRDVFGFAMKATNVVVADVSRAIQKDPETDSGLKKSMKGLIRHEYRDGVWSAYDECTEHEEANTDLPTIFRDGVIMTHTSMMEIRKNVNANVKKAVDFFLAERKASA